MLALAPDLDFGVELARGRLDPAGRAVLEVIVSRRRLRPGLALRALACARVGGEPVGHAELELGHPGAVELTLGLAGGAPAGPLTVRVRAFALDPAAPAVAYADETPEDDEAELTIEPAASSPGVEIVTVSTARDLGLAAAEGRVLVAGLAEAAARTDSVPPMAVGTWTLPALRLVRLETGIEPPLLDYETGEVVLTVGFRAEGPALARVDYRLEQTARTVQDLLSGTLTAAEASRSATSPVPFQEWERRLAFKVGPDECGHTLAGELSASGLWLAPDGAGIRTAPARRAFTVKVPEEACAEPAEDEN